MKRTSQIFIRALKKQTDKNKTEFEMLISRMQSYEVMAFYSDVDSSYKEYSEKYFNEAEFKKMAFKIYSVDLDDYQTKEDVYSAIYEYSHTLIYFKALNDFIKVNDIDIEDTS